MLLERETELVMLRSLVEDLPASGGKVVLIRGEAGIGKSALINEFLLDQRDRSEVLFGGCDDLFIPQPLGPFWDMARSTEELRPAIHAADRHRLLGALMQLVARPERPTLLVVEDTHWADEATLDVIRYLGRRIGRANGLLLLTYRDGEVDYDHPLRGVIGDIPVHEVVRLRLDGLSRSAVSILVGASTLQPDQVLEATRGNPLLVTELATASAGSVPASLQDSLHSRLARMSIAAQEALKTLSVIPEPIPWSDAVRLAGSEEARIDECVQRGFLEPADELIAFRHELIRRTIESSMNPGERRAKLRIVLDGLPEKTHPCLLIHCAVEVEDVDRLVDLAPRSARYAAAAGSHVQAAEDFREVGPHLDRFDPSELGPLLDEWAREEYIVDNLDEATRIGDLACSHYRETGEERAEARALSSAARYHEVAGHRDRAEALAASAIDILGDQADGAELARALEVSAYLQVMAGNEAVVAGLVDRALAAGGPGIDAEVLIRSLNHKGTVLSINDLRAGREYLERARVLAEEAGLWVEVVRALSHVAWAAVEVGDIGIALDHARQAVAIADRNELLSFAAFARALEARALELGGAWDAAMDIARDLQQTSAISQMVALPVIGVIDARRGRQTAAAALTRAWEMASSPPVYHRMAPVCSAAAEHAWITGDMVVSTAEMRGVLEVGLEQGYSWSTGSIVRWLSVLEESMPVPDGIAQPYRLAIEGRTTEAAAAWEACGLPYERALVLQHGSQEQRLEALDLFEMLGATAVVAKQRKSMRDQGMVVPRGKGRATRRHAAGLTARQAEVLELLADDLSNNEIADRLFVSPRTVENHVAAVLDKLDAMTRADAVESARTAGLLEPALTSG